jgi:hypothetical protein
MRCDAHQRAADDTERPDQQAQLKGHVEAVDDGFTIVDEDLEDHPHVNAPRPS